LSGRGEWLGEMQTGRKKLTRKKKESVCARCRGSGRQLGLVGSREGGTELQEGSGMPL